MKEFSKLRLGRWFIFGYDVYVKNGTDTAMRMYFSTTAVPYEMGERYFNSFDIVVPITIK